MFPQAKRKVKIQTLHAVALFAQGEYDAAINIFINLDINPAKVVALYPEEIAGRLAVPESGWIELHGGSKSQGDVVVVLRNDREVTEATDQTVTVEQGTPEASSGEHSSTAKQDDEDASQVHKRKTTAEGKIHCVGLIGN